MNDQIPLFKAPPGPSKGTSGSRVCPGCQKEFRPYNTAEGYQAYCSDQCRGWRLAFTETGRDALGRISAPYQPHSDTSREAAEQIEPTAGTERSRVLALLREVGGLTDEQIQDRLEMNPSTERPRRVELCQMGFVHDSGEKAATRSGRRAVVWDVKT